MVSLVRKTSTMGSSNIANEHIVMLPFMAQGHLIPFLALAQKIQQKSNFSITIASTPLNISYLRTQLQNRKPEIETETKTEIHLSELPFPNTDHGLPPNTENTENLRLGDIGKFGQATTCLQTPFHVLIQKITADEGRAPICIISDVFCGWASEVAESCGTSNVTFSTCGAYGTAAYISVWQNLPHRDTDSDEFNIPGFPTTTFFQRSMAHKYLLAADGTDEWSLFFRGQISLSLKSRGWLCNTVEEVEPVGLDILRKYTNQTVWTIGPLLPESMLEQKSSSSPTQKQRAGKEPGVSPEKCVEWLDSHSPHSVVYISFGSQNTISPSQMMEMAKGLEMSRKPFIWAIRPPLGFDMNTEFKPEWLPLNFEARVQSSKVGLIVHKWAPQLEILSHKSTGAFLSHCGWNSVLESLSQGVPIIGWPLAAEQAYNSKMLVEEMGVGVELTRGINGVLTAEEVRRVVHMVMEDGEMKRKAGQIGVKIRGAVRDDGSSVQAMDDFVADVLSQRK